MQCENKNKHVKFPPLDRTVFEQMKLVVLRAAVFMNHFSRNRPYEAENMPLTTPSVTSGECSENYMAFTIGAAAVAELGSGNVIFPF